MARGATRNLLTHRDNRGCWSRVQKEVEACLEHLWQAPGHGQVISGKPRHSAAVPVLIFGMQAERA